MPNSPLPQRDPSIGLPDTYSGAPGDVVELFAEAVREWANLLLAGESSSPERCVVAFSEPKTKLCPRCAHDVAEPDTGICRYCTADIEHASRAIVVALRDTNARTDCPLGWLQRDDGSWAPVDDHGNVGQAFVFTLGDHHEFEQHAVITVESISIDNTVVD
ncbi:hypothetical protein ACW2Q0_19310 [Nocardia sp. R16R-3T]